MLALQAVGVIAVILTGYLFADRMRIRDRYIGDGNVAMHDGIRRAMAASDTAYPGAYKVSDGASGGLVAKCGRGSGTRPRGGAFRRSQGVGGGLWRGSQLELPTPQKYPGQGFCPWYILLTWPPRPGMPPGAPAFTLHPGVVADVHSARSSPWRRRGTRRKSTSRPRATQTISSSAAGAHLNRPGDGATSRRPPFASCPSR